MDDDCYQNITHGYYVMHGEASKKKDFWNTVVHRKIWDGKQDDSLLFWRNTFNTGEGRLTPFRLAKTHLEGVGNFLNVVYDLPKEQKQIDYFDAIESLRMVHWPLFHLPRKNRYDSMETQIAWTSQQNFSRILSLSMSLSRRSGQNWKKSKEANPRSSIKNLSFGILSVPF